MIEVLNVGASFRWLFGPHGAILTTHPSLISKDDRGMGTVQLGESGRSKSRRTLIKIGF